MAESQAACLAIHQRGEILLAAGNQLGQGHTGIVAGLDDHAMQQFIHGDRFLGLDEHA